MSGDLWIFFFFFFNIARLVAVRSTMCKPVEQT